MAVEPDRTMIVVVHDVAPTFLGQLEPIFETMAPRLGGRVAAAVVPSWRGVPLGEGVEDVRLRELLEHHVGEVLQHGETHERERPGWLSGLSGRSDELAGRTAQEARGRIERGRDVLSRWWPGPVRGFLPPAWQNGPMTPGLLAGCGFGYLLGFDAIRPAIGAEIPVATWSWDWGIAGRLGRVGGWFGAYGGWLRPGAVPSVAVHPADVDRGLLPACLRVIDRLRAGGRTPALPSEVVAARPAGAAW